MRMAFAISMGSPKRPSGIFASIGPPSSGDPQTHSATTLVCDETLMFLPARINQLKSIANGGRVDCLEALRVASN